MREKAFAKINLGLWILGKRADGYHDIITFMHEVMVCDHLTLWKSPRDEVVVTGEPIKGKNIIMRAVSVAKKHYAFEGVKVLLEKRIPVSAGLGGGSSDAAAALRGVFKLWGLALDKSKMMMLASEIGSDVPFFLEGGFSLVSGRGEKVKVLPFSLSKEYIVLIAVPSFRLSTAEVYSLCTPPYSQEPDINALVSAFREGDWDYLKLHLKNDLEKVAFQRYPELQELKGILRKRGALFSSMSGSGSSVFAVFKGKEIDLELLNLLNSKKCKVFLTSFRRRELKE